MDIDIDVDAKFDPQSIFDNLVPASTIEKGELKGHNVGYYFQSVPVDQVSGLCAINYKETEKFGYYKTDFLPVHLLSRFESREEMKELLKKEPKWELMEDPEVVKRLFQVHNKWDFVIKVKPRSLMEVSDLVALIRPKKQRLLDKYLQDPEGCREELYTKRHPTDFRKAHCIPYAMLVILNLHLVEQGRA